ncbi:hypothetical protein HMPREF1091_01094 [Atopobium minutum 10063974]|uniref:Uncharacterized protein n=1 Tax=Atopobium minutum 10063974 TaxID=997872 RepID=N2BUF4_9ACTN|nr:hypothetical protein HMPREF1091_01094 [Atopobium minutum 10063974]
MLCYGQKKIDTAFPVPASNETGAEKNVLLCGNEI